MSKRGGVKGLLCLWVLGLAWTYGSAQPGNDDAAMKYRLHIVSEPLDQALQDLAAQSGVQIVFFSTLTEGLRGPTLNGLYTINAALDTLLASSSLTYRMINSTTIQIIRGMSSKKTSPHGSGRSRNRSETSKNAASSVVSENLEEVTVTGLAEHLVATRTATPLSDIPQTVSIISAEEIDRQSDTDLTDALRYAPGITVVQVDSMDNSDYYSRGFQITTFHIDGGAALSPFFSYPGTTPVFMTSPDLSEFDHIELLRGSDALFGGLGNPGGTVSLVRKVPLDTFAFSTDLSTGSWSNDRAEVDLTGPLAFGGALRARVDGLLEDRDYSYGLATLERKRLFGVIEYDITPATLVRIGGSYQRDDTLPFVNGLPRAADGSDPHLPVDTSLTFDWSRFRERMRESYLQVEQKLVSGWKLRIDAEEWDGWSTADYGFWGTPIDPVNDHFYQPPYSQVNFGDSLRRQFALDATVTGTFPWFSRRAEVAFGADFTHVHTTEPADQYTPPYQAPSPVFPYDPSLYPSPILAATPLGFDLAGSLMTRGVFGSLHIPLTAALSLTAGTRLSSDETRANVALITPLGTGRKSVSYGSSNVLTPYAGLMYALDSQYSVYASYADIYQNQAETEEEPNGRVLGAESGVDRELGIKAGWREHTLNGTLVFFKISQDSVPLVAPSGPQDYTSPPYCCYLPGTSRSYGVDIEVDGTPARGWLLTAGYTYDVDKAATGGAVSAATPRHIVKLWTSKQLSGAFNRLTVGGGLLAQSANSQGGSCYGVVDCPASGFYRIFQGSYALVDLRASFRIDSHWEAALTLNNVFNRTYYQSLGRLSGGNWYGDPRNWQLRTKWEY